LSSQLITTLGPRDQNELGLLLPHEHLFVDLRTWRHPEHALADLDEVVKVMTPEVDRARAAGVTAIVEATTGGVGRRPDILHAVSRATGMPIAIATGYYREPWLTSWVHEASEAELRDEMLAHLEVGFPRSEVRAGWIKLSAGDDGMTRTEAKVLRAAAQAAAATGATIGSHTVRGRVVRDQLDVLRSQNFPLDRFVWIHAQREPDFELHLAAARLGAWIEYDGIGRSDQGSDSEFVTRLLRALDSGLRDRILISHDRLGYDAAQGGPVPPSYDHLSNTFLPLLRSAGADSNVLEHLTRDNPFSAFARTM